MECSGHKQSCSRAASFIGNFNYHFVFYFIWPNQHDEVQFSSSLSQVHVIRMFNTFLLLSSCHISLKSMRGFWLVKFLCCQGVDKHVSKYDSFDVTWCFSGNGSLEPTVLSLPGLYSPSQSPDCNSWRPGSLLSHQQPGINSIKLDKAQESSITQQIIMDLRYDEEINSSNWAQLIIKLFLFQFYYLGKLC